MAGETVIQVLTTLFVLLAASYLVFTIGLSRTKKPLARGGHEPSLFVFVVPALNEERVIAATVDRLLACCGDRGRVVVINDGSTDATGSILAGIRSDWVWVIERTPPNARQGKGAALNDAYQRIRDRVLAAGFDPRHVVLGIVDADGRLEPRALEHVAPYFRDPAVGAVQVLVRIRNRARWLCRFQDYEFLIFSGITQTAREKLGSVGLGGNGQFTRLAALMELGDAPWSDCLTEDLDLGVRLALEGWENRFCGETFVDQQGLTSIPLLLRQRTRWAHGHFQCWKLIPRIIASDLATVTVLDTCYYLLAPALVIAYSVMFTAGWAWFAASLVAAPGMWFSSRGLLFGALMYVFSMAAAIYLSGVYWRRSRDLSLVAAFVMAHLLVLYNFVWYIAELRAVSHIIRRKRGWAKTARSTEPSSLVPFPDLL